jgi:hypothetical protein
VLLAGVGLSLAVTPPAQADGPGVGPPAIVSMGDSSISGEGGRWAGGRLDQQAAGVDVGNGVYNDFKLPGSPVGLAEEIPTCHRSDSAEVHIGGGLISKNLACSGSMTTTYNITSTDANDPWKPGLDSQSAVVNGQQRVGQVQMLEDYARTHNVKAILVGVSANDYNFADIVARCVERYWFTWQWMLTPNYCNSGVDEADVTDVLSPANQAAITQDIVDAIARIRNAMVEAGYDNTDYQIIMQTYWSSIPRGDGFDWPERDFDTAGNSRIIYGGCPLYNADATWLNDVVLGTINDGVKNAYSTIKAYADNGWFPKVHLLDMQKALVGHRLCERPAGKLEMYSALSSWKSPRAVDLLEWVVAARPGAPTPYTNAYSSKESAHANYFGQMAMRNCLRQAWNGGNVRGGRCEQTGEKGLTSLGEPKMVLQP